ncbi:hypothetical protein HMPREF1147_1436 [Selenomonas sp. FOBRC9]|nr:hypothetical protein HMPREF1147_1436 [Selenomonas sp. FOBRC9]
MRDIHIIEKKELPHRNASAASVRRLFFCTFVVTVILREPVLLEMETNDIMK